MTQLDLFYNTTHMSGSELTMRRLEAGRQNRIILEFFKQNPRVNFTPFDVQRDAGLHATPITSIRRAINTLTQLGFLVKTDVLKEGAYGAQNHTWRLA